MSKRLTSRIIHRPDPTAGSHLSAALDILASVIANELIETARQEVAGEEKPEQVLLDPGGHPAIAKLERAEGLE